MGRGWHAPWAPKAALWALATLVLSSVLMLGSVQPGPGLIVGLMGVLLGAALLISKSVKLPLPAWLWLVLSVYTALSALPLPLEWLRAIAPANADVWSRALLPLGEPAPRYASTSLAPAQSLLASLHGFTYAMAVWAGYQSTRRFGIEACLALGLAAASVVSLTTLAHGLLGVSQVYGLYQPSFQVSRWAVGPLLNSNNLAGYLCLGVFSGLGLLLSKRERLPRWPIRLALLLCAAGTLATGSRGGISALLLGLGASALWYFWGARKARVPWGGGGAFGVVVLGLLFGGLTMGWVALQPILDPELGKLSLLEASRGLMSDHGAFGVGRGGFGSAFHAYVMAPRDVSAEYAENFPVQWLSEWGVPVAVAALMSCLYVGWRLLPKYRRGFGSRCAALGGLLALTLQNLVDLSFEVPGVSVLFFTLMGAVWSRRAAKGGAPRTEVPPDLDAQRGSPTGEVSGDDAALRTARWARLRVVLVLLLGMALLGLTMAAGPTTLIQERAAVHQAYAQGGAVRPRLREAMLRFPAEPYFSRVGALAALRAGEDPMPWLQRALERGMNNGRTHLLVADVLIAKGHRGQALLELRIAMELHDDLAQTGAARALRLSRDPEVLRQAVPRERNRARVLLELAMGLDGAPRERFLREALEQAPDLVQARAALARELFAEWSLGAKGRCAERLTACREELVNHVDLLGKAESHRVSAHLLRAQLALAEDDLERATSELVACRRQPRPGDCLRLAVQVALRANPAGAREVAEQVLAEGCLSRAECGELATQLAALFTDPSQREARWRLLRRAAEELDTLESWRAAARAAESAGHLSDAYRIISRQREIHPGDVALVRELERLTGLVKPR